MKAIPVRLFAAVALATTAALSATGCGSSSDAAASAETTTAVASPMVTADPSAGLWDPCTGIPADVLRANGVNPVQPKYGRGVPIRGWKRCGWLGDWFSLSVLSTHHTVDELKSSGSYAGLEPVTVGDRSGITQHQSATDYAHECVVSLPAEQGMVEVMVAQSGPPDGTPRDLCAKAEELTTALLPYLPK